MEHKARARRGLPSLGPKTLPLKAEVYHVSCTVVLEFGLTSHSLDLIPGK
jgi:hypothetical protein